MDDFDFDMEDLDGFDFDMEAVEDGEEQVDPEPPKKKTKQEPAKAETKAKAEPKKKPAVEEEEIEISEEMDISQLDDILVDDDTAPVDPPKKRTRRTKEEIAAEVKKESPLDIVAKKDAELPPPVLSQRFSQELVAQPSPSIHHLSVIVPADKLGEFYTALGGLF